MVDNTAHELHLVSEILMYACAKAFETNIFLFPLSSSFATVRYQLYVYKIVIIE